AHQIGGVAHEGSFPGADVGLSGSATGCAVRLRSLLCGPCRGGGPPKRRKRYLVMALPRAVAPSVTWRGRTGSGACPAGRSVSAYGVMPTGEAVNDAENTVRLGGLPEECLSRTGTRGTSPWWRSGADLRLTLPDPTNIPPLQIRQPCVRARAEARSLRGHRGRADSRPTRCRPVLRPCRPSPRPPAPSPWVRRRRSPRGCRPRAAAPPGRRSPAWPGRGTPGADGPRWRAAAARGAWSGP